MADRIVTIAASGEDYTSISAAIAGEADFQAGEDNIIFRRTDNVRESNSINVSGFTTSASHQVIIECTDDVMHDGTRDSGAGIDLSSGYYCFYCSINYVTIRKLELQGANSAVYAEGAGSYCTVERCLMADQEYNGVVFSYADNSKAINCLIYSPGQVGINLSSNTNFYLYYNTILNCGTYGIFFQGYATTYIKNCYVGGSATADISVERNINLTTTFTEDGSHSTTQIALADCAFTSYTDGSEDANISSGSDLIDVGTSLSGDGVHPVTTDIFGTARGSSPDVGAIEYVATITGNSYYYQMMQR